MTKGDLVDKVAGLGLTKKKAGEAVEATFEAIKDALQNGERVQVVGFGNFSVKSKPARKGRNPRTGAEIEVPAKKVPVFKASGALKDAVR